MAGIEEIKDQESLAAWLVTRPRADSIAIAQRAALRVLPLWGREMDQDGLNKAELKSLPLLRCVLISGVANKHQNPETRAAASSAYSDAPANALDHTNEVTHLTNRAVYAARTSARAAYAEDERSVTRAVRSATSMVFPTIDRTYTNWSEIRNDAFILWRNEDPFARPLWQDSSPDWFIKADAEMRAIWAKDPASHWAFWTRWWDGVLAGKPLNWDLQHDIAVKVGNDVWNAGPGPVAEAIAGIETPYLVDAFVAANPYAMDVFVEAISRKLVGQPVESPDLDAVIKAIRTALADFASRCKRDTNPNGFGTEVLRLSAPVIDDLRRDMRRYRDNPLRLFDALEDTCRELQATAQRAAIPQEGVLFRLIGTDGPACRHPPRGCVVPIDRHA